MLTAAIGLSAPLYLGLSVAGVAVAQPGESSAAPSAVPASCDPAPKAACLVVTGTDGGKPIPNGQDVHFTFDIANRGGTDIAVRPSVDTKLAVDGSSFEVDGAHVAFNYDDDALTNAVSVSAGQQIQLTFAASREDAGTGPITTTVSAGTGASAASGQVETRLPVVDLGFTDVGQVSTPLHGNPLTGIKAGFAVVNNGVQAQRVQLSVILPQGWSVRPATDDEADWSCAHVVDDWTCRFDQPLSDDDNERFVTLAFLPPQNASGGTTLRPTIHLQPAGATDEFPADNTLKLNLVDAGTSALHVTAVPSATQVAKGKHLTMTVTIRNDGPDATSNLEGFALVDTTTHHGFFQDDPRGPGSAEAGSDGPVIADNPYAWDLPVVEPGHKIVVTLRWRGDVVGASGRLKFMLGEDGVNPGVPVQYGRQVVTVESALVTVRSAGWSASTSPSPHSSSTAPSSPADTPSTSAATSTSAPASVQASVQAISSTSSQDLADTGSHDLGPQVAGGVALLSVGAACLMGGRRRRTRRLH